MSIAARVAEMTRAHTTSTAMAETNALLPSELFKPNVTDGHNSAGVCAAGGRRAVELASLPREILIIIANSLLPAGTLTAPRAAWRDAMNLGCAASLMHAALLEAIGTRIPVVIGDMPLSPAELCSRIGLLLANGGGRSRWRQLRPLQPTPVQRTCCGHLEDAPRLSGASLCCIAPGCLCVFGGHISSSGETLDTTYFVTVRSSMAIWERMLLSADTPRPPARCYHTGTVLKRSPLGAVQPGGSELMIIFGGAGAGEGCDVNLLSDLWMLVPPNAGMTTPHRWMELNTKGERPMPRSSHVCAPWLAERALIFHGGLTSGGVTGDVFLLRNVFEGSTRGPGASAEWVHVQTRGEQVRRAHHVGGVVGESTLLVLSGQDETLITKHTLAALDLRTWTWSSLLLSSVPDGPSARSPSARIDAGGIAIEGVGLVVFGGVRDDFSFVPAEDAWLLLSATDVQPHGRLARHGGAPADDKPGGPSPRACLGLCADGLSVYIFGGFDGDRCRDRPWTELVALFPHTRGRVDGLAPCPSSLAAAYPPIFLAPFL